METRTIGICIAVFVVIVVGWLMLKPAPAPAVTYGMGTYDTGTYATGTYDTGPNGSEAPVFVAPPAAVATPVIIATPSVAGSYKIVRAPDEKAPPPGSSGVVIIEANASGGFKMYESTKPDQYDLGTQTGSVITFAPPPGLPGLGPGIKKLTQTVSGAEIAFTPSGDIGGIRIIQLARVA